jgi:hypothetical protein
MTNTIQIGISCDGRFHAWSAIGDRLRGQRKVQIYRECLDCDEVQIIKELCDKCGERYHKGACA